LELLDANRATVDRFIATVPWHDDPGDSRRTAEQVHLQSEHVPLLRAYEELLMPLRFTDEYDSQAFTGALLQIGEYPGAARVGSDGSTPRHRRLPPYGRCAVVRRERIAPVAGERICRHELGPTDACCQIPDTLRSPHRM
jgi:hypothetical protein